MFDNTINAFKNIFTTEKIKYKTLVSAMGSAFDNFDQVENTDQLLAETGKTRQELLDAVLSDDEVLSCREDLETAIKAKKWRITGDEVDEELINRFYKVIQTHIDTFVDLTVIAMFSGYSVAEYVYTQQEDGLFVIDRVLDKDGELDNYQPLRNGYMAENVNGEWKERDNNWLALKYLLLTNKAKPARPSGELSIIRAYPAVALRKKNWAYAGQFIARYAQPYVVGKNGGYSVDGNTSFTNVLYGFLSGGATGIGKDDSIEMHQLTGTGEAFDGFERMANRRIQKIILGKVKQSEMKTGSRASQQVDNEIKTDRVNAYLNIMTKAIQHAIDAMLTMNKAYGLTIHAPQGLWFEYPELKKADKVQAEVDKMYADTGQIRFTKQYYLDLGYEEEHFEMVGNSDLSKTSEQVRLSNQQKFTLSKQQTREPAPLSEKKQPAPLSENEQKERELLKPTIDTLLSICNDCEGYLEFESRLSNAQFDNDELVKDLAGACADEYVQGVKGN